MDKRCKKTLQYLNSEAKTNGNTFNIFFEDYKKHAEKLSLKYNDFENIIGYLIKDNFLEYIYYSDSTGEPYAFKLTYEGLHYREIRIAKILHYIADNWINFLALLVSAGALIVSIIALYK